MSFSFPKGAKDFFRSISLDKEGPTKFIMFDEYYCCLLLGLDARQLGAPTDVDAPFLSSGYPEDYRNSAEDLIAGLLIDAELDRKGVSLEDRSSIEAEMIRLLDPTSPTRLSKEGNDLLNQYAAGGFQILRDSPRILPPANLEEFLVAYHDYWNDSDTARTVAQAESGHEEMGLSR